MKICFSARPAYDKFSTSLFSKLKVLSNSQIDGIFISQNSENTEYIKEKFEDAVVYQVNEFLKKVWNDCTIEKLSYYEKKFKCSPIWKYIYTDRFLVNMDYDYCIKTTTGLFIFYENIFKNHKCDFYYDETIAVLQSYIAYIVAKFYGVRYISQMAARGADNTHHYFLSDPFQYNTNFDKNHSNKSYPKDVIKLANEFLTNFENKNIKPANIVYTGTKPRFLKGFFKLPYIYLKKRFDKKCNDIYDYINYHSYNRIFNGLVFYFRYHISKKYYNKPNYNCKYVFYPLHYQPEASTLVCSPKYEKQLFFIDSWAKSLPADTVLFVKEHYAFLGHRTLDFYKQLEKYPNVILIDPWEDSRKLIANSVAVTTLTGTSGWEAMLLRKPVILGGNIYFDNAPGVVKTDEIFDKYIDIIDNWVQPTREEVIHYLCEYFTTIYKGNVCLVNPRCYDESNIEDILNSLIQQIYRMVEKSE
ncbi:MAG: hypothetical protein AB6733_07660 [Clostridiaceae bacterium]